MRSLIAVILSAVLLFSIVGCGGDKKADQTPAKTATTQEVRKETPKEKTAFIVGTEVNAREKASIDSGIVGTYDLGEKVTILADEGEWAKVKRTNGQECYVFKKFLGDQAALDNRVVKDAGFTEIAKGGVSPSISRSKANTFRMGPVFKESGSDFWFTAVYSPDSGDTISFDKGRESKWKAKNLAVVEPMGGHDTMQLKDNSSGKIFYALSSNAVAHAYILGYDFEKDNAVLYINSDDFYNPFNEPSAKAKGWYTVGVNFVLRKGSLYLVFSPSSSNIGPSSGLTGPVAYKLFWNPKANKFGYEDVGSFKF